MIIGSFLKKILLISILAGFSFSNPPSTFSFGAYEAPVIEGEDCAYLGNFSDMRDRMVSDEKDFLELNLDEMKAKVYDNGVITGVFPISKKSEDAPAGIFSVASKKELVYLLEKNTYLPWSINYYGNDYVHAKAYRLEGEKSLSRSTTKCLRLEDNDAQAIFSSVEIGEPVLVIGNTYSREFPQKKQVTKFPALKSKSFLVADLDSGFIIAQKNSQEVLPIASLTKLMTAISVKEQKNLKSTVLVRQKMLDAYGSTHGLDAGKRYTLEQLFYPLLQESSNDAAQILGTMFGKGGAVELMNERAESVMMKDTKFVDTHGFSADNVSTARDLFYLARYAADFQPEILDITKGKKPDGFSSSVFPHLYNKNFFYNHPNFIGGKTGYITESKYNGLFIFNIPMNDKEKKRIAIILLGAPHWQTGVGNLKEEAIEVLVWLYTNYNSSTI